MPQYQGVWSLQQQMQALTSGQWVTDPLFDYTTLLLQADDAANSAQNNTFLDSSTNAFAITRNGNTTQGTFSPFSATGWSTNFVRSGTAASNTRLLVASNAGLGLQSNNFCIELWAYFTSSYTGDGPFCGNLTGTGYVANTFWFGPHNVNSGNVTVYIYNFSSSTYLMAETSPPPINQWVHYALVRNGSTFTIYRNGISTATATFAGAVTGASSSLFISRSGDSSVANSSFDGYMSNLRVVNGSSVYTANFTPPQAPLTAIANTGLLTLQSNRWVDNSTNAAAITVDSGTPSVQAFSPFAPQFQYTASGTGGSGYFDGSGDTLSLASTSAALPTGTETFSCEFWFYFASSQPSSGALQFVSNPTNGGFQIYYTTSTGAIGVGAYNIKDIATYTITAAGMQNQWMHCVVTRSGNDFRMFINGILRAYASDTYSYAALTTQYIAGAGVANSYVAGTMTGFRCVRGSIPTTYQTSSTTTGTSIFTPPTAPPTTSSQGATAADTKLLLNFTNAGIYDGTMKNNLETVGNAQISTSVVKYGSGSMYFDGTNDYLLSADTSTGNFGSGDFTIEFWAYDIARSASGTVWVSKWGNSASLGRCWVIGYVTSSTSLVFNISTDGSTSTSLLSATITPSLGTWNHYAVTRAGNTYRMFLNGTLLTSAVNTGTLYAPTKPLCVGANYEDVQSSLNNYAVNGYMDDVRLTRGIARYTQNFIPPSVALPRQ